MERFDCTTRYLVTTEETSEIKNLPLRMFLLIHDWPTLINSRQDMKTDFGVVGFWMYGHSI